MFPVAHTFPDPVPIPVALLVAFSVPDPFLSPFLSPHPHPHPHPTLTPSLSPSPLPHHRLIAYTVARDLVLAVIRCSIRDPTLRDHALRASKSACLNCAEGAGRVSRRDKARAFAIARAEAGEAAAAVEIAALRGDAPAGAAREVARIADRLVALLTGLVR
jgi:four helix bundle protein